ncbi:MAG: hypothetical protein V2J42_12205, partial [Wenzhouxiangella sp.]|nr:hypothetical protein [Wenzhouxiangella sp.]
MNPLSLRFSLGLLVLMLAIPALATRLEYALDGVTFSDGGTATGTFVYDTELDEITTWNIMTSGGNEEPFPPFTYSPATSTVNVRDRGDLQPRISFVDSAGGTGARGLRITPTLPLANGGEIPLQLDTPGGGVECFNCNPFRSITAGSLTTDDLNPGFAINPGLNGSWFNPATPGQGFFLDVFPQIGQVFFAWFTYDTALPGVGGDTAIVGSSGHRWLTAQGSYFGDSVTLDVFVSRDGLFDDPRETSIELYGTISLTFTSCTQGNLAYDFPGPGLSGQVLLERVFVDP